MRTDWPLGGAVAAAAAVTELCYAVAAESGTI